MDERKTQEKDNFPTYKAVSVDSLIPYARNSRTHSDSQVAQIAASIKEFGFLNPIIVDGGNGIIAGHGRLMAAQKLGLKEVPVVEASHLNEAQRRAYVIADNKLALNAGWDDDMLRIELTELGEADFDLELTGFSLDEIDELQIEEIEEGLTDEDAVPEIADEPVTVEGDVWLLGNHRLMCGDSTSIDAVEKLMAGSMAHMTFTDPPYNIGFSGTMSNTTVNGVIVPHEGANSKYNAIHNDKKSKDEFYDFIASVLGIIKLKTIGGWYICFASSTLNELLNPLIDNDMKWKSIIIWNKSQSPMGGGHFRKKYEPIAYGYFENIFYGKEYSEDDVWDIQRTLKNDLHPTMKPVPLAVKAIEYSSKKGQVVLDLFGGSGTTLIASEQTGRHARLMELDPKYCDVIIRRWQDFTGKKAVLESTGQEFEELEGSNVTQTA